MFLEIVVPLLSLLPQADAPTVSATPPPPVVTTTTAPRRVQKETDDGSTVSHNGELCTTCQTESDIFRARDSSGECMATGRIEAEAAELVEDPTCAP